MRSFVRLIPVLVLGAAVTAAVAVWRGAGPSAPIRVPNMDAMPGGAAQAAGPDLAGTLTPGPGKVGEAGTGQWASFRGNRHDGISEEAVELRKKLDGLTPKWSVNVGEGYGGPAIRDGRVYLLDYDQTNRADALRCLALADGREIWRHSYAMDVKRNHGMSRTVPAVTAKVAVTMGPKGHLVCVDAVTGTYKWGVDLTRAYGTKVPPWYAGQCPLIDAVGGKDAVILAPAGEKVLLTALSADTGQMIWETPNDPHWSMTHVSVAPVVIKHDADELRQYVYCGNAGVMGVDAATGKELWRTAEWQVRIATVPTPVDMGNGHVLLTGGYGAGAAILELTEADGKWNAKITRRLPPEEFGAEQHTPIVFSGHIFGVRPDGQMACLTREGVTKWLGGPANRIGLGSFLIADNSLYAISDTGTLLAVEARPDAFTLQGRVKVMENARECWAPMALADGQLLVRDLTKMVCLDMRR